MKKILICIIGLLLPLVMMSCEKDSTKKQESTTTTIPGVVTTEPTFVETGKYVIENESTEYVIVKSDTANSANEYAATELQHYIAESTGVTIPIVSDLDMEFNQDLKAISIGKTTLFNSANIEVDYDTLNGDGFVIKTLGNSIFIEAEKDRGLLFGVYDFVEKLLGVRYFSYDSTKIPQHEELPLYNLDIVEAPAFAMRTYLDGVNYWQFTNQDFALKLRTNGSYTLYDQRHGGRAPMYGRHNDHNFAYYVPYEIYGQTHPEFYVTDSRFPWKSVDITNGITEDGKIDETMDVSVIKIAIEEMIKDVKAYPEVDYFVFEQEDGDIYCRTEKCNEIASKYTRAGMLIRFVNILADEVQKWADEYYKDQGGRDIKIVTFAYSYTAQAPLKIENDTLVPIDDTVVVNDNVVIRLALGTNAFYHYFDQENQNTSTTTSLANWKKLADRFMFWGYDIAYENYLAYFPSFQTMQKNVEEFEEYGMEYFMMQSTHNTSTNWQSRLRTYVYSKLMWNPDQDVSALMNEYMDYYYGEIGAPYVKEFMQLYDEFYGNLLQDNPNLKIQTLTRFYGPLYTPIEIHEAAYDLIAQAIEEVKNDESLTVEMRNNYLVRLSRVLATPMSSILLYYNEYYLTASALEKQNYAREFFELCEFAGVDRFSELYSMQAFKESLGY